MYIKHISKSYVYKIHCIVDHIGCLATFAKQKMKQSKAFYGHKAMGIETIRCCNLPTNIGSRTAAIVFYLSNIFCIFLRAWQS